MVTPWGEFCGHGIGEKFHEDPQVVHYGRPGTGELLRPGTIFTVEPMINMGKREVRERTGKLADGWTILRRPITYRPNGTHSFSYSNGLRGADYIGR